LIDYKFTILVRVYNGAPYILRAVDSINKQTYKNFNVIFINDGSTDESEEIINDVCSKFSYMRHINFENQGPLLAHINGFSSADKNSYIVNLDVDDELKDNLLEDINRILNVKNYDVIIYDWEYLTKSNRINSNLSFLKREYSCLDSFILDSFRNHYSAIYCSCDMVFKASLFGGEGFDESFHHFNRGEDLISSFSFILNSKSFYYLDKPLYLYHLDDNPKSVAKTLTSGYQEIYRFIFQGLNKVVKDIKRKGILSKDTFNTFIYIIIKDYFRDLMNSLKFLPYKDFKSFLKKIRNEDLFKYFKKCKFHSDFKLWLYFFMIKYKMDFLIYYRYKHRKRK